MKNIEFGANLQNEILTEDLYTALVKKYTTIIVNHMIHKSEIAFYEIDEKLKWDNLEWLIHAEDHYPCRLYKSDLDKIVILTKIYSKYFNHAVMNKEHTKYQEHFEDFAIEVFLRECYVLSIIEYTRQYSEKFNDKELLNFTLKFFDENIHTYFEGLSGYPVWPTNGEFSEPSKVLL